ncbi:MAG: peptidoglycan DD-metalloendopeptidase family protein [Acidobacteriota bacterium]
MKQHTIIFVPHARAKFRKWRVSTFQVCLIAGTLTALTVGGVLAAVLYLDNSFDRSQLGNIQQENADLREVNQRFETSIRDLEGQLKDYQERIHKLAIVAGVAELSPATEPGIGGAHPRNVSVPGDGYEGGFGPKNLEEGGLQGDLKTLRSSLESLGDHMEILQDRFDERHLMMSSTPTIAPAKGIFTSGFGYRRDPFTGGRAFHQGIDIAAPHGHDIYAPGDGIVTKAGRERGYGITVYLSHGYGLTTRYGHLSGVNVEVGQEVRRGDVIGFLGSTGRSTGNHLHYEVRVDGRAVNPLGYILDSNSP